MATRNDDEPILASPLHAPMINRSRTTGTVRKIRELLRQQLYGVLCSQGENQAYGSVVAFAASGDFRSLFFSTPVYTRKYRLVSRSPSVAFVVDNRCHFPDDMAKVEAVTATGRAREVRLPAVRRKIAGLLAHRHPQLKSFVAAESCAIFEIKVFRYFHVTRFQEVGQWLPPRAG
ncbi:MAG: pyridoxamine 5'-phosphate oxidase family protein [Elusimicrobia bacterium]|nr:pyridoxamine 5'-phosphate oxidase family protein [Elusimicrobiota bacterium]MBP9699357.1 pyridoxamine 5'-phosphate oxidase family protein [Elusimicrobiota bacterium]